MSKHMLESLVKELKREEDCPFCKLSLEDVGYTNDGGSSIIYKTGNIAEEDWYAVLQPTTPADPVTGFNLQFMPVGHVEAFADIITNPELGANQGKSLAILSYAMNQILEDEWDSEEPFLPMQIVYGKCLTPENSLTHIHYKLIPFSGDIAQAFPSDNGWVKKYPNDFQGERFVIANPVEKRKIEPKRYEHLKKKLIEVCDFLYHEYL